MRPLQVLGSLFIVAGITVIVTGQIAQHYIDVAKAECDTPITVDTASTEIGSWQEYAIEQCGGQYDQIIITSTSIQYICSDKDNVEFKLN